MGHHHDHDHTHGANKKVLLISFLLIASYMLIEAIGEEPARIDGLLNQLRMARKLEHVAGVVIGDFARTETSRKWTLTLDEVLDDYFATANYPVVKGFKIGHCEPHFAIPLGVEALLNADEKTLTILPGVE